MKDIEFISYDGKYPNLCSGVLTLRVDGQIRQFDWCLISGGYCDVYEDLCKIGEWDIKDDVFSSMYEFAGFRIFDVDSEGESKETDAITVNNSDDEYILTIPGSYQGSELSIEPIGAYQNRVISLSDY